ncbi:MAG TPA: type II secretion system minor pseudopilin GspK [Casimicrobiaceae bacterium]|nr:type II secretion system minor pseudopilin GspK [Casimicrobiaceae bacterium]
MSAGGARWRVERGAAIVLAMLLAALAATIAATLLWQQQRWVNEHEHRRDQVQAQALAMAGVQWARQIVRDNAGGNVVDLGQPWALKLPALPIENGSIGGYIIDAQSRINIDNLAGAPAAPKPTRGALERLFAELALPAGLLDAIADWVDADDRVSGPGGAEDAWYLARTPPGLAANAAVRRTEELLAVRGAEPGLIARALPFISALDPPAAVNVNTAPPEVLVALVGGLDAAGSAAIVASRKGTPFITLADFRSRLPRPDLVVDETLLSVRSDWFEVTIEARQGDTLARARALLHRSAATNAWPTVVWQVVE